MIARLRDRASVRVPALEPDGQGGRRAAGHREVPIWVGMEPTGLSADPETGRARRRFRATVRYSPGLLRDIDRFAPLPLLWRGRTLLILSADDPDLRGERLHLICEDSP